MLRLMTLLAAGLLLALAPDQALAAGKWVRGARPDLLEQYKPQDGHFKCLDGTKTIEFARVNDNYCDCPDGSDEPGWLSLDERAMCSQSLLISPLELLSLKSELTAASFLSAGTSACPAGAFYCRNRGHEPKLLSASFVDDGICGEGSQKHGAHLCQHLLAA